MSRAVRGMLCVDEWQKAGLTVDRMCVRVSEWLDMHESGLCMLCCCCCGWWCCCFCWALLCICSFDDSVSVDRLQSVCGCMSWLSHSGLCATSWWLWCLHMLCESEYALFCCFCMASHLQALFLLCMMDDITNSSVWDDDEQLVNIDSTVCLCLCLSAVVAETSESGWDDDAWDIAVVDAVGWM